MNNTCVKLSLAPLHGVTNRVFRKAYFNHFEGIDSVLAPFILSVPSGRMKETHFKDLARESSFRIPVVPQILGNDAAGFIDTAHVLAGLGYTEVNWNLGCPYPMVAKKMRGSGLLPYPARIADFLDAVCPRLEIPLSIKLRLGRTSAEEILSLMPVLNEYPLVKVIIHPRVGIQMYKGSVDLEGFARAKECCSHEVVYNGDIKNLSVFKDLSARFPTVSEWMIGRWAISDPFLAGKIQGLAPVAEPLRILREFHDELFESYKSVLCGPGHVLDKMKEVWTYLSPSISGSQSTLASVSAIARVKTLAAYEAEVNFVFSEGVWNK